MNISTYEERENAKALQEQANFERQQIAQRNNYIRQLADAQDQHTKSQQQSIEGKISAVPESYRRSHELNELQSSINQRLGAERASNLGLANSGYARLQQTSAQAQRQRHNANLNTQQQGDINALRGQIQEIIANAELQKQTKAADVFSKVAADIFQ